MTAQIDQKQRVATILECVGGSCYTWTILITSDYICTTWGFHMGNHRTLDGLLVGKHQALNLVKNRLAQAGVGETLVYM